MGLLGNLFGKQGSSLGPVDLGVLGVDIHSHFIPGIDDGAQTMEQSMELLSAMAELGYRKVITTPHNMADGYKNTPEIILGGLERVRDEVRQRGIAIEVDAAAEYYLDHELEKKVADRKILTFGQEMVLFELPFISEPNMLLEIIFQMQTAGYRPVLAHPERYAFWYTDFTKYERLKERGVLFQLNMIALSGAYGPQAKQIAERLVDAGHYELLGSDCHNMNHVQAIKNTLTRPHLHKLIGSGKLRNASL
ncbi:MAG: capsular biosynthesis protein [Flavobacteriales bacterium]|jgi:protein-tyrosine phosphatase|nr:capsular biosynthesis protein [Flavobacteriales bacterium]MBK6551196.1 capsular biosynthesis protein [Flavobacteriales bacterium]MBK6884782.1 capsular biosynthesis protein [Flavobacteriales bacterium]MBK7620411.1 capsular biosynthesis protein [Flavobacteriales bacterium]MBK8531505.1 capsular biosynthesis protein [Flavobacteriales bacterium]